MNKTNPLYQRLSWARCTILIAALLFGASTTAKAADANPQVLEVGINTRTADPGFANVWIGEALGFFAPKGISVDVVGTQGASEDLELLLAGKLQVSTGVQDPIFAAMANGQNLPVISPCTYQRGVIYRTAVLDDSPYKSFQDLKGKTIGVLSMASATAPYTNFALQAAGVDPSSTTILATGDGQQAAAALQSGRVDAISLSDISIANLINAGVKIRLLPQPASLTSVDAGYVFAFRKDWYNANKVVVQNFLQAEIKSIVVLLANPEAAVRITYHMFPESQPKGIPLDVAVQRAVRVLKVRAPYLEKVAGNLNRWCEFSPSSWNAYVKLIGLQGKVDPAKFYTNEMVETVNDFDDAPLRAWAKGLKVPEDNAAYSAWLAGLKPPG